MKVQGTVTTLGDDIDTDTIFPGRYLAWLDPKKQAEVLFEPLGPEFRDRASAGGVVVAGWNFGCGSSREHAVTSMLGAGIRLVVARTFSRIYFRNAINLGLAVIMSEAIVDAARDGSRIEVDLAAGTAAVDGKPFTFEPLPPELLNILSAGGLWAAAGFTVQQGIAA